MQVQPPIPALKSENFSFLFIKKHLPLSVTSTASDLSNVHKLISNLFRMPAITKQRGISTGYPLLEGVPAIPKGEKMEGTFFPLLHQATQ